MLFHGFEYSVGINKNQNITRNINLKEFGFALNNMNYKNNYL